jgi:hypothetical protein
MFKIYNNAKKGHCMQGKNHEEMCCGKGFV